MSIGKRIFTDFDRVDESVFEKFKEIPVANIGDATNRLYCLNGNIKAINKEKIVGQAYTVKVPDGDNLLFYYALDNAKENDVIVVSGNGFKDRALCGEIMVQYAYSRGLGGFIVDGAIRDVREIRESQFPVFASYTTSNGPYKNGPGEINVPVVIDGKVIHPGDIIIASEEGIISIPLKDYQSVLNTAIAIQKKEKKILDDINNKGYLELNWMYEKIKEDQYEIINQKRNN